MTAHRRTLRAAAIILGVYFLLVAPGFVWPAWFETPAVVLVLLPLLAVYLFHKLGVPGLLEHNGLCGWGMCAPTPFGYAFTAVALLTILWMLSRGIIAGVDWMNARRKAKP